MSEIDAEGIEDSSEVDASVVEAPICSVCAGSLLEEADEPVEPSPGDAIATGSGSLTVVETAHHSVTSRTGIT